MAEQKKIDITFRIASIKTTKFLIENIEEANKTDKATFEFNISIGMFANPEQKIIGYNVFTDVFTDKTKLLKVSELATQIIYDIINFDEVISKDETKKVLNIPDIFITTLISIALSTTRGIFAAKTEGSVLDGVYIPIMDPKVFKPVPIPHPNG
jgi:hypothetical protein